RTLGGAERTQRALGEHQGRTFALRDRAGGVVHRAGRLVDGLRGECDGDVVKARAYEGPRGVFDELRPRAESRDRDPRLSDLRPIPADGGRHRGDGKIERVPITQLQISAPPSP